MKQIFFLLLFHISLITNGQSIYNGYTDKSSYRLGEAVNFYTKSTILGDEGYLLNFKKLGVISSPNIFSVIGITPSAQLSANTSNIYQDGLNYTLTKSWVVPFTVPSGVYISNAPISGTFPIPLIIKSNTLTTDVIIVYPTNTGNAYCNFGGKSSYNSKSSKTDPFCKDYIGDISGVISPTLSFNRQLLPNEDFANKFADGFLNWINSADRFGGHSVGFISDADMDDYTEIENAKLIIIIGHSEYWTRQARENFDRFVNEGKQALILSGNTMWWQVRLQTDPANSDNPQMVCNKYEKANPRCYAPYPDLHCDPLLQTSNWNDQSLKFSTLGSIGSDWGIGGFSGDREPASGEYPNRGFGKHKVLLPSSPILSGVSLVYDGVLGSYVIDSYKTAGGAEVDGTLVKGLDAFGNPILDKEALGFYKAELIAYDKATYRVLNIPPSYISPLPSPFPQPPFYTGIMAMQKTCTSGRIINVNCNEWCTDAVMAKADMQGITQNMIDLLLSGANIFADAAPPDVFTIKPAKNNVSYEACASGRVQITPCGVTIYDGYKVDHTNQDFSAKTIDCITCTHGHKTGRQDKKDKIENEGNVANDNLVNMYPNPNNGQFTIEWQLSDISYINLTLESINGQVMIQQNHISTLESKFILNANNLPSGIYFMKLNDSENNRQINVQKIIIDR